MTQGSSANPRVRDDVGRLCLAGDHACEVGDLAALREIAYELANFAHEPLHCELAALAEACVSQPGNAIAAWDRLKARLYREAGA